MADFYADMAKVSAQLLAPTSQGGLGQGVIVLARSTPGTPNPNAPWEPVTPTVTTETLKGAARGVDSRLVGTEVGGAVILASDRQVICAPPAMQYQAGDTLSIDGVPVHVIAAEKIPAAGVTSAVKFIVRG
jgi:hypothetical protein